MALVLCAHAQLSWFYLGSIPEVTSCTRPSHYLACNIEKLGMAWG